MSLPDNYWGRLTPRQVADGISVARRNALELVDDAEQLRTNGRLPRAAALAIEESGKSMVLRQLACARDDKQLRDCWRRYRRHTAKNILWPIIPMVRAGARSLDHFTHLVTEGSKHPVALDRLKQASLYTDCVGSGTWSLPADAVDEQLVDFLLDTARVLSPESEVTAREIELWIEHVGEREHEKFDDAKRATANYFAAMEAEGLGAPRAISYEEFLFGNTGLNQDVEESGRAGRSGEE